MQVGYLKLSNVSKVLDFLRIFKWYKNVLLFIPSLLVLGVIPTLLNINLVVAFILLGMVSSGLYIIKIVFRLKPSFSTYSHVTLYEKKLYTVS